MHLSGSFVAFVACLTDSHSKNVLKNQMMVSNCHNAAPIPTIYTALLQCVLATKGQDLAAAVKLCMLVLRLDADSPLALRTGGG